MIRNFVPTIYPMSQIRLKPGKILKESICHPEMSEYVWHFSLKIVKARKGGEETDRRRGGETKIRI